MQRWQTGCWLGFGHWQVFSSAGWSGSPHRCCSSLGGAPAGSRFRMGPTSLDPSLG